MTTWIGQEAWSLMMQDAEKCSEQEVIFLVFERSNPSENLANCVWVKKLCDPVGKVFYGHVWDMDLCFFRNRFEPLQRTAQTGWRIKLCPREQ